MGTSPIVAEIRLNPHHWILSRRDIREWATDLWEGFLSVSIEQLRAFPDPLMHQGDSQADLVVFQRHERAA